MAEPAAVAARRPTDASPWPAGVSPTREYQAAYDYLKAGDGHLFVTGSEPSGAWGMVDPQTGRDLLSLTGWTRPMSRDQTVKPLVTMRAAGQLDRVWVAMVEVGVPAARALGQLTGVRSDQCWQTAGYLACRRWSLDVAVWRYPVR